MDALKPSAQRVQAALQTQGFNHNVIQLPDSARTAQEAANALGCEVGQIAKSLVFRRSEFNEPLLIIASGKNRVNEKKVAAFVGKSLEKPDADFVRDCTGFAIGGIPPIGHKETITTLIDEELWQYDIIWAAAGHPKAVFQLTPDELLQMSNGQVIDIK